MSLSQTKTLSPSLLEQLLALNDLVKTVANTKNLDEIISNLRQEQSALKKQYDDLSVLKNADEATTKALNEATLANRKSEESARTAKKEADDALANSNAQISKASQAQKSLAQAQADLDAKTLATNNDLSQRLSFVADRETKAKEALDAANKLKDEYESKLNNLKKITGG